MVLSMSRIVIVDREKVPVLAEFVVVFMDNILEKEKL